MLAYRSRRERHAGSRQPRSDLGQEVIDRGIARTDLTAILRRGTTSRPRLGHNISEADGP